MQQGPPRRRRPRPAGEAPLRTLLSGGENLTKGWLLALLEQAPLEEAPGIVTAEVTRDGPRICQAVIRAIADDDDLRRLEPGGQLEPLVARLGQLAGATAPGDISRAVDALRAIVWSAIRTELPAADRDQIAELAERLALVAEVVRGAALGVAAGAGNPRETVYPLRPAPVADVSDAVPDSGVEAEASAAPGAAADASVQPDALWIGAVEDEIARAAQLDAPLSLLLVELDDAERVASAEPEAEAAATFNRFAQALRAVVRRKDILALETETRAWIIARETGRVGAQALASRAASSVGEAPPLRGAPMTVSAGIAVLGEDGRDAPSLIETAEEAKYAAAAAGVSVLHELPPEGNGGTGPRLVS